MAGEMYKSGNSLSGLTDNEAREFHSLFMSSTIAYVAVAVVAHVLVWLWRPWFPSVKGYALLDGVKDSAVQIVSYLV
jgi:light-harvesting complex 1 beta chain